MLLAFDFSCQVLAQTQIVNCDAPVQSRKRGIAVNSNMSAADFQALDPGVSWFYDWGVNNWTVPSDVAMELHPDGLEWLIQIFKAPSILISRPETGLGGYLPSMSQIFPGKLS